MKRYAFIISTDAVFGIPFSERSVDEVLELLQIWMKGFCSFGINLPFTKFGKAWQARQELLHMIREAADLAESAPINDDNPAKVLKRMVDMRDGAGNSLDRDEIGDVMLNLIFAGES